MVINSLETEGLYKSYIIVYHSTLVIEDQLEQKVGVPEKDNHCMKWSPQKGTKSTQLKILKIWAVNFICKSESHTSIIN